jgi:hypothetical protein
LNTACRVSIFLHLLYFEHPRLIELLKAPLVFTLTEKAKPIMALPLIHLLIKRGENSSQQPPLKRVACFDPKRVFNLSPQYDAPHLRGRQSSQGTQRKALDRLKGPRSRGPDDLHRENGEPSRAEISSPLSCRGGLSKYFQAICQHQLIHFPNSESFVGSSDPEELRRGAGEKSRVKPTHLHSIAWTTPLCSGMVYGIN